MAVAELQERAIAVRAYLGTLLPDEVRPRTFEVICIRAGEANGLAYAPSVLRRSVEEGLWKNVTVFANHAGPLDNGRPGGRAIEDVVGVLTEAHWTGRAVMGSLVCRGPKADLVTRLAEEVLAAQEQGEVGPNIGLSADMYVERRPGAREVDRIVRVNSLDVVYNPAAGGAFLRVLNGGRGEGWMEEVMAEVSENEDLEQEGVQVGLALEKSRQVLAAQCSYLLDTALRGSSLPQPFKDEVRMQLGGKVFRPEELDRTLQAKQATWARLMEGQVVRGVSGRMTMRDEMDRVRLATERLFGLPVPEDALSIPRLSGIRELYLLLTGDDGFHGRAYPERAQLANVTTSTMTGLTADVLNKVMLQAYNRRERWWEPIVANRDLERFQDMKMIRTYGFSALSTVTEGNSYTEKTWGDLQETAEIIKKGNYVGVTLEMIMADDLEAVRAIPQLLGTAAWNTVSDAVSAVFTANGGTGPLMSDEEQLFAQDHGNLGTTALDVDAFEAAQMAIMTQTDPGSLRPIGVPGRYLLAPVQLRSTAMVIRNSVYKPGGEEGEINPWYDGFEVLVVPTWTDADNWAVATDPSVAEHVVLGWLQGRREPEIFAAADETIGSMFTNDEMRVKVRFFICCGVADYRGLYKANVTTG